jgi:demethoxyubiquinone hydroxylase (CLK1/Coq7/Cat5 family)
MSKITKRILRTSAFALGAGIAFMGAGSIFEYSALESALFGATGAILGLVMALAFTYAGKGSISDQDFDGHINESINSVTSKTKDK